MQSRFWALAAAHHQLGQIATLPAALFSGLPKQGILCPTLSRHAPAGWLVRVPKNPKRLIQNG
jgi:hypothetical protein